MRNFIQLFLLMCIVSIVTSCNTHKCSGLSKHPNFNKNWK
jgi:hypothetical protein